MNTFTPKPKDIKRGWYLVDAQGLVLGRLASFIAGILRGKNKTIFAPYADCGDFVIVTNSSKIVLTGKKLQQKIHFRHSGYPRGDKYVPYSRLMKENPEKALKSAVRGMLPKNRLRDYLMKRLKVYRDANHSHLAQKPVAMVPNNIA